jgi:hypothetical protein
MAISGPPAFGPLTAHIARPSGAIEARQNGTSGADRPTVRRDPQTRASPPDWIPGQPRANHTADGEYDENAAAQG